MPRLSDAEVRAALAVDLPGWALEDDAIRKEFVFQGFLAAIAFIDRLAPRAHEARHHPDLENHYNRVLVSLSTHDEGGVTRAGPRARTSDRVRRRASRGLTWPTPSGRSSSACWKGRTSTSPVRRSSSRSPSRGGSASPRTGARRVAGELGVPGGREGRTAAERTATPGGGAARRLPHAPDRDGRRRPTPRGPRAARARSATRSWSRSRGGGALPPKRWRTRSRRA